MHKCKNVNVANRRTSIRLEEEMWDAVDDVCRREGMNVHELCTLIDRERGDSSLTAGLRLFLLIYYRSAAGRSESHRLPVEFLPEGGGGEHLRPVIAQVFQG